MRHGRQEFKTFNRLTEVVGHKVHVKASSVAGMEVPEVPVPVWLSAAMKTVYIRTAAFGFECR